MENVTENIKSKTLNISEADLLKLLVSEEPIQNEILDVFESEKNCGVTCQIVATYEELKNYYITATKTLIKLFAQKLKRNNKKRRMDIAGNHFTPKFPDESSGALFDVLNLSKFHSDEIGKICLDGMSVEDEGNFCFSNMDSREYACNGNEDGPNEDLNCSCFNHEESFHERTIDLNSLQPRPTNGTDESYSDSDTGVFNQLKQSLNQLAQETSVGFVEWIVEPTGIKYGIKKKIIETVLSTEKIIHFTTDNAYTSEEETSIWPHVVSLIYPPGTAQKHEKKLKQYLTRTANSETSFFGFIITRLIKIHQEDCPVCRHSDGQMSNLTNIPDG